MHASLEHTLVRAWKPGRCWTGEAACGIPCLTLLCQDTVGLPGAPPLEGSLRRSSALPPRPAFLRMPPLALGEPPWACA